MGQWTINVEGHGIHDNSREDDAEAMLAKFVDDLENAGHQVHHASFTVGTRRVASWDSKGPGTAKAPGVKWVHGLV